MKLFQWVGVVLLFLLLSSLATLADELLGKENLPLPSENTFYIISYSQDRIPETQHFLQKHLSIERYLYDHRYVVYASTDELSSLQKQGKITSFELYPVASEVLLSDTATDYYYLHLFSSTDKTSLVRQIADAGIALSETVEDELVLPATAETLYLLSSLRGVEYVGIDTHFAIQNDLANTVSGTKDVRQRLGLYGSGEIVAVGDTGLDTGRNDASMHDDLEGRILHLADYGARLTTPWDRNGHGTHVAASVLGNGILSGSNPSQQLLDGSYTGAAPEAQLVFQALGDNQGTLGIYPPSPLGNGLFLPAYTYGARVHSNSWGVLDTIFRGTYMGWSQEADAFVFSHKDMVITFAAGNYGSGGYATVIPPSTAKNILSVGSVVTTSPTSLASSSSMGPTRDGRIKPDLLAPGVSIISARSSQEVFPCQTPSNPSYCIMSGTSMATPNAAGIAALTREYYRRYHNLNSPSAALIKATLINAAEDIGYGRPSFEAGWGRINISASLPADLNDLAFHDEIQGLTTSQSRTYRISVASGKPLDVTLVWTDRPSSVSIPYYANTPRLVSDLDLVVIAPTGQRYYGNDITLPYDDQQDRLNNVEHVGIPNPAAGSYTLEVRGFNVPLGTQDYAWVAHFDNGFITSSPAPIAQVCLLPSGQPC